jgi:hypothetical protein
MSRSTFNIGDIVEVSSFGVARIIDLVTTISKALAYRIESQEGSGEVDVIEESRIMRRIYEEGDTLLVLTGTPRLVPVTVVNVNPGADSYLVAPHTNHQAKELSGTESRYGVRGRADQSIIERSFDIAEEEPFTITDDQILGEIDAAYDPANLLPVIVPLIPSSQRWLLAAVLAISKTQSDLRQGVAVATLL